MEQTNFWVGKNSHMYRVKGVSLLFENKKDLDTFNKLNAKVCFQFDFTSEND